MKAPLDSSTEGLVWNRHVHQVAHATTRAPTTRAHSIHTLPPCTRTRARRHPYLRQHRRTRIHTCARATHTACTRHTHRKGWLLVQLGYALEGVACLEHSTTIDSSLKIDAQPTSAICRPHEGTQQHARSWKSASQRMPEVAAATVTSRGDDRRGGDSNLLATGMMEHTGRPMPTAEQIDLYRKSVVSGTAPDSIDVEVILALGYTRTIPWLTTSRA